MTNDTESKPTVCEWRITGTLGERIQLNFTDFLVQASNDCEQDYVEVRDGYWHKSPLISTTNHT